MCVDVASKVRRDYLGRCRGDFLGFFFQTPSVRNSFLQYPTDNGLTLSGAVFDSLESASPAFVMVMASNSSRLRSKAVQIHSLPGKLRTGGVGFPALLSCSCSSRNSSSNRSSRSGGSKRTGRPRIVAPPRRPLKSNSSRRLAPSLGHGLPRGLVRPRRGVETTSADRFDFRRVAALQRWFHDPRQARAGNQPKAPMPP